MKNCAVIIPARYHSTRFPAKVLAPLEGKPVLQWCYEAAQAADIGPVWVATDHAKIQDAVAAFGGKSILTDKDCPSGTDRVAQAFKKQGKNSSFVINLQGDEPLVSASALRHLAQALLKGKTEMATLAAPLHPRDLNNPNVVKIAKSQSGQALYFSRNPIPYSFSDNGSPDRWQHIGIYGFTREALFRFVRLRPSPLERAERLEQLRALENNLRISVVCIDKPTVAIDTPQDLQRALEAIRERKPL